MKLIPFFDHWRRRRAGSIVTALGISHHYHVVCRGADGRIKWEDHSDNLVVTAGLNDILDKYYKGATYTAAHYVGLKLAGTIAAGDTMSSHAGWAESSAYSNANRPTLTMGTVAAGSVDNSASKASFTINGTATITGAFVSTNNTKGGTTGTLVGATDFSVSRSVISGDTLDVTVTASLTAT
jgi:hypothetical protein